jgi:hypothetical protein
MILLCVQLDTGAFFWVHLSELSVVALHVIGFFCVTFNRDSFGLYVLGPSRVTTYGVHTEF